MPLFETAAGRSGPSAATAALREISTWAQTPSARRCCLHAARIYKLLLNRRFSDAIRLHSMVALFQASLVLGLFVFVMPDTALGSDTQMPFNLIEEEVDWVSLSTVGLSQEGSSGAAGWESAASRFILNGGRMYMADSIVSGGYVQARKCWLRCVHLMLSLGRWNSRIFSRILHVMADSLTDLETGGVDDAGQQTTG
ncbi:hypothetical protein Micbo1qcDRAFT_167404 [Microdochium bolleyi]|uniref:Uncharacterized protein n=1 Tax=Microdochium bolleyi TaxID=196109 RepID=A0A136ISN4_9PEZI|nr:hypothetical protein Micbo1qcDRAFT_167404 [Microdochium bolleyi]